MLDSITKGIAKVFGTKSDRDLKLMLPVVTQINEEYKKLTSISDDQLRGRTSELKAYIGEKLKSIDDELSSLHAQIADNPELDINAKDDIFKRIDELEERRDEDLEVVLKEILPQGFAVVKETARRLSENKKLEVSATLEDKQLAANRDHIEIKGSSAIWHNKWLAAGTEVEWNMVHYDVQLI